MRDSQEAEGDDDRPFRRTNTSAYYRSIEKKRKRYTPSAEELADDHDIRGDSSDDETITEKTSAAQVKPQIDQARVMTQIED